MFARLNADKMSVNFIAPMFERNYCLFGRVCQKDKLVDFRTGCLLYLHIFHFSLLVYYLVHAY